jgi:hypothetical protein
MCRKFSTRCMHVLPHTTEITLGTSTITHYGSCVCAAISGATALPHIRQQHRWGAHRRGTKSGCQAIGGRCYQCRCPSDGPIFFRVCTPRTYASRRVCYTLQTQVLAYYVINWMEAMLSNSGPWMPMLGHPSYELLL